MTPSTYTRGPFITGSNTDTPSPETGLPSTSVTDPLSFERDIAPLSQRFFQRVYGSQNLKPEVKQALMGQYLTTMGQAFEQRKKAAEIDQISRSRELQYQSSLLSLQQAREEAENKRNMLTSLVPFNNQIKAILDDTSLTSDQRKSALGRLAVESAPLITTNPTAATAINAARTSVTEDDQKPKQFRLGEAVVQRGISPSYLKKAADELGLPFDPKDEESYLPTALIGKAADMMQSDELIGRATSAAEQKKQELKLNILGKINDVAFYEPKDRGDKRTSDEFKSPADKAKVDSVLRFGNPEERKDATKEGITDKERYAIAQKIAERELTPYLPEGTGGGGRAAATAGLFSTKPE